MIERTRTIRRRPIHIGVIAGDLWMAHDRRNPGAKALPVKPERGSGGNC